MPFIGTMTDVSSANGAYTSGSNLDIALTKGNYIFSVRSGGVYHYNGIFMVTYYDSADKASVAGSVNLNKPDENSAAYNDIFKKYLPILFEVKELKE